MVKTTSASGVAAAAEGLIAVGRSDEARRLFRRALDLEPGDVRAAAGLIRLLLSAGDLRAAVAVAESALSRNPDDVRLMALQGDIGFALYHAHLWEDAEHWLARATTLEPWNSGAVAAYERVRRPGYLAPDVFDPQIGRSLRRYSARES